MKAEYLKISKNSIASFYSRHDQKPVYHNRWHYHPEIEIIYIKKGEGTFIIGDCVSDFKASDIFVLGSNVPHLFNYSEVEEQIYSDAFVLHIPPDFFNNSLWSIPELKQFSSLFEKSSRGIKVSLDAAFHKQKNFEKLNEYTGFPRLRVLFDIMEAISESESNTYICSLGYTHSYDSRDSSRLDKIYQYVLKNFQNNISLEEISEMSNLSSNSFCRYFKSKTNKTFTNFLIEVRLGHACKLLSETDFTISQVCFESGYNNISNFNRHFKRFIGKTPKEYATDFRK